MISSKYFSSNSVIRTYHTCFIGLNIEVDSFKIAYLYLINIFWLQTKDTYDGCPQPYFSKLVLPHQLVPNKRNKISAFSSAENFKAEQSIIHNNCPHKFNTMNATRTYKTKIS